jgi:alpha-tubulin suppressor-like RCC1 family protein
LILSLLSGFVVLSEPTAEAASSSGSEYAEPATEDQLNNVSTWFAADNGASGTGAYAKLIEGKVYVWGQNRNYVLGITSYTDSSGTLQDVTNGTIVSVPTQIPQSYFGETGDHKVKVTRIQLCYQGGIALTSDNKLYIWGARLASKTNLTTTSYSGQYPVELPCSAVGNNTIISFRHTGSMIYVEDSAGNWYTAGGLDHAGQDALLQMNDTGEYLGALTKIPDAIYTSLGTSTVTGKTRTITMMDGQCADNTLVLTDDGKLFVFGISRTQHPSGCDAGTNAAPVYYVTTPGKISELSALKNLTFTYIVGEDQGYLAIDTNGDVWAWGCNNSSRFGTATVDSTNRVTTPQKIFDHNAYQKNAVRAWLSFNRTVILCDDNTVYAIGNNSNGIIDAANSGNVTTPTQILTSVSKEYTIVGVYPSNNSQMAITKSGDMLFAGDNSTGGAGNGTTSNEGIAAGSTVQVVSEALPPSAPVTTNKVSFEIEVKESDGLTYYYTPLTNNGIAQYNSNNKMLYQKRKGKNANSYDVSTLTLDAGANFKLNVYFNDFGKIDTFVMPIRFDQRYVQVVNSSGVAYSTEKIVSPGAYSASVGIVQDFDSTDWEGGRLGTGSTTESYPKICNGGGWVSIMGYSYSTNPEIKGNVEMFSISFRATSTAYNLAFDFATNDILNAADDATDPTYDMACNGLDDYSAYWSIINTATDVSEGANGYFSFDHEPFPKYDTKLVQAQAMTLALTYGDNDAEVTKTDGEVKTDDNGSTISTNWDLNWGNSGVVYKMTAHLFSDAAKTMENVSYPYVNWTYELVGGDATKTLTDYITIIEETDTYVRFKINPDFEPATNADGDSIEPEAAIKFTAVYQSNSKVTGTGAARLMDMQPPSNIYISQLSGGNYVPVADGAEIIYTYTPTTDKNGTYEGNLRTFYVTYGDYTGDSREVVWTLLDSDGNTIYSTDADAKAVLGNDNTETVVDKHIVPSVTVLPYNSTPDDDYLTLRCESLYKSSVYDEVKIKVHLKATAIAFSPETICIPVSTDLTSSSVKLSKYLGLTPLDAWSTDYTWSVDWPDDSEAPANWEKLGNTAAYNASTDAVVYGQLNSSTGELVAFEYATPKDQPAKVTVTDSVSGLSASIYVKLMDVDSPIGINDFEATNNLGYMNDTLKILSGLAPSGGSITSIALYQDYDTAVNVMAGTDTTTQPFKTVEISDDIREKFIKNGYFSIAAYSGKNSLFKNEGGFIGVVVYYQTGTGDNAVDMVSDVVPVQYDQEPNIVDGYVHLFGRAINSSQQAGIRIDLVGLNFKETVYTDSDGYFKFTKYIAPGTYTMTISKVNYLTRYIQTDSKGNGGIVIPVNEDSEKFHISTSNEPIILYPGELTNDNSITIQDVTYYVSNWVGITDKTISNFVLYDFAEDGVISTKDLELLLMRKDWTNESYPAWTVPDQ